ncbi:MAG: LamG domain-containing protein [Armatimonadetes bacterium]|nr:LamG domain-containing protein [Armatimonadota bacterium]PIY47500.1 MAG: hypothetical protein COZ05_04845 [Armatimonadetes bacterium CG_4_10_14_3_um_filter_59_10]
MTQVILYRNGVPVATAAKAFDPKDNGKPLLIGCMKPGVYHFNGRIDEMAVYKRSLSGDEVTSLFRSGIAMMAQNSIASVTTFTKELVELNTQIEDAGLKAEIERVLSSASQSVIPIERGIAAGAVPSMNDLKQLAGDIEKVKAETANIVWKARLAALLQQW